jgi:hypothetical protein
MSTDVLTNFAKKAGLHNEWHIDNPEIEAFVKLIVVECADICYQHSANAGGVDTPFGFGYKDCGDDIKSYFGVE